MDEFKTITPSDDVLNTMESASNSPFWRAYWLAKLAIHNDAEMNYNCIKKVFGPATDQSADLETWYFESNLFGGGIFYIAISERGVDIGISEIDASHLQVSEEVGKKLISFSEWIINKTCLL